MILSLLALQVPQKVVAPVATANLVVNGDFSSKRAGFASGYRYSEDLDAEGTYMVGKDPYLNHPGATTGLLDHTSGNGMMMIVNGSVRANLPVWQTSFKVKKGEKYDFSAWVTSWGKSQDGVESLDPSPGRLLILVDGKAIHSPYLLLERSGHWGRITGTWNSSATKTVNLTIIDENTDPTGNDFALDDIAVTGPAEPKKAPVSSQG